MDFSDDSFNVNVNTYNFYFLHGIQSKHSLLLFGKLKYENSFNPCTIVLSPVTKCLYVKTKDVSAITATDFNMNQNKDIIVEHFKAVVEDELNSIVKGLTTMPTYCSEVVQKYTIHSDKLQMFLKIQYQLQDQFYFDNNNIPKNSCIDYIYGLKQNALNAFLLEKNIKGPSWLKIETYSDEKVKSCRPSVLHCHPNDVNVVPPQTNCDILQECIPALNILFLEFMAVVKNGKNDPFVFVLSFAEWNDTICMLKSTKTFIHCGKNEISNTSSNKIIVCDSSNDIIQQLHKILTNDDINIIICYDKQRFTHHTNNYNLAMTNLFLQYIVIDLKLAIQELSPHLLTKETEIFEYLKDINNISHLNNAEENTAQNITKDLLTRTQKHLILSNKLNIISIYKLISNVTGCPLNEVCSSGHLKRVEYMLKHELHSKALIREKNPNLNNNKLTKIKSVIRGGKILEPKVGYYNDLILAFDFKSLYPSVIQEYNLSFASWDDKVLPKLMSKLTRLRQDLTTNEAETMIQRSTIIKALTNSVYGCLSSEYCDFYYPTLANLITKHGRELLTELEYKIPSALQCAIIFGHTDSVFVELLNTTDYNSALNAAVKYLEVMNNNWRFVRLKLEGVFSHGIIFDKQNYALRYHDLFFVNPVNNVNNNKSIEQNHWIVKGVLKKTTPRICHDLFHYFLDRIVVKQPRFVRTNELMCTMTEKFGSNNVDDYVMHVQLQNAPESYKKQTPYGHIVSRRNFSCHGYSYKQCDTVSYVICTDGTNNETNARAYDVEEFKLLSLVSNLRIDKNYYKRKQAFVLLEKIFNAVPQYVNVDSVTAFLKPEQSLLNVWTLNDLPAHFKLDNILPFHFRCVACCRFVVISRRYSYEYFVECVHCNTRFVGVTQSNEIVASLKSVVDEYLEKFKHVRRLTLMKGTLGEKVSKTLACLQMQYFKQITLWKEVMCQVKFTLEWFTKSTKRDNLKIDDDVKLELKTLFDNIDVILDKELNDCNLDCRLGMFDFNVFYG